MLEYLIKVTNNTFYTAMPIALLMAFLYRLDAQNWKKFPKLGFWIGIAAAVIYAALKRNTGFAVREYYDLGAIILSLISGLTVVFCCLSAMLNFKVGRALKNAAAMCVMAGWIAYAAPDLLLYPYEFAVGMDNVFNTEFMFKVVGYSSGLLLSGLSGYALFKASLSLGTKKLAPACAVSSLIMAAKGILTTVQILLGRNMIPRYRWLTSRVIWALSHENFFTYLILALSSLLVLALIVSVKKTPIHGGNPAEIRKARFLSRRITRFCASTILGVVLSLLTVTVGVTYSNKKIELSPPLEIAATGDEIVIPLDTVNDGTLHRFVYKAGVGSSEVSVRYIVIKKNETSYGVGLDACDVCGPTGYYERKGQVVCILCDVVMNKATIGLPGGCNPVPLKFGITGGNMTIKTADLAAEARRF
ncbi:MAG: DUF2318 domain-containing protein [Synergistaceae bacterium]|jgi:uncharacterized membrane protein|nr:DUF2318 domain-containing protein [Synergistaceae bacterium]